MQEEYNRIYLGIDVGGTHTDAVLCSQTEPLMAVKVPTCAANLEDVACSIQKALQALRKKICAKAEEGEEETGKGLDLQYDSAFLEKLKRITVSTTLGLNTLVQGRAALVGLVYTAGPGMDPRRFLQDSVMGQYAYRVEGGLDHRGEEVTPLNIDGLAEQVSAWRKAGVQYFAVAGKFALRHARHELAIAAELTRLGVEKERITMAHKLSGQLNFIRRMAAAYVNASVYAVQQDFLQAVYKAVQAFGAEFQQEKNHTTRPMPPLFFLKADGGAISFATAMDAPLHTVFSGPAASVMGGLACMTLETNAGKSARKLTETKGQMTKDCILLDVGGTTTDVALYAAGVPVLDAQGMRLTVPARPISPTLPTVPTVQGPEGVLQEELRTPLRALATHSVNLGGDTPLLYDSKQGKVSLGNERRGPAVAFGGKLEHGPTLSDALLYLQDEPAYATYKTQAAKAMELWGAEHSHALAEQAVHLACMRILQGVEDLLLRVAERPVYTLAQLLEEYTLQPRQVILVGGPAQLLQKWLAPLLKEKWAVSVHVPEYEACANALGAALTLPTDHVEFLADTLQGQWHIPQCSLQGKIPARFSLAHAETMAHEALARKAEQEGMDTYGGISEIIESQSFAILDAAGRGGKDMRVCCQWRPGIVWQVAHGLEVSN